MLALDAEVLLANRAVFAVLSPFWWLLACDVSRCTMTLPADGLRRTLP